MAWKNIWQAIPCTPTCHNGARVRPSRPPSEFQQHEIPMLQPKLQRSHESCIISLGTQQTLWVVAIMQVATEEEHCMFYSIWRKPWKTVLCSKILLQKYHRVFSFRCSGESWFYYFLIKISSWHSYTPASLLACTALVVHLYMIKQVKRCGQSQCYCHDMLCFHRVKTGTK